MKDYKIFRHPDGRLEPVKQGWSWPAFFFSWIWAMIKKMWALGLGVGFVLLFINVLSAAITLSNTDAFAALLADLVLSLLAVALSVAFGMKGNAWREAELHKRGYSQEDVLSASSPDGATALFLNKRKGKSSFD